MVVAKVTTGTCQRAIIFLEYYLSEKSKISSRINSVRWNFRVTTRGVSNSVKLSATNIKSEHRETAERNPLQHLLRGKKRENFLSREKEDGRSSREERWQNGHDIVADGHTYIYIYICTYICMYVRTPLLDIVSEIVPSWGGGRRREEPPPLSARGGIGRAGGRGALSAANGVLVSAFQGFCPPKSGVSCARRTRARERPRCTRNSDFSNPKHTYIKAAAHRSPGFTIATDGRMSSYFVYSTLGQPHDNLALHPVRPSPFLRASFQEASPIHATMIQLFLRFLKLRGSSNGWWW